MTQSVAARWVGLGSVMLALTASAIAAPEHDHEGEPGHSHRAPSGATARSRGKSPTAQEAARTLAGKGIMPGVGASFRPEQFVTRGELAIILVRMIDYLERQGPKKVALSKSPPLVTPRVRTALKALPKRHRAYAAVQRLALGGYLLGSGPRRDIFFPTRQNIDRPVTANELAVALAGISSRIAEKRTVLEHPEVLQDQRESVGAPGQHRGAGTPPP